MGITYRIEKGEELTYQEGDDNLEYLDKKHFLQTTAPTEDDDVSNGFQVGFKIENTTTGTTYKCTDNSVGAAIWEEVDSGGDSVPTASTFKALLDTPSDYIAGKMLVVNASGDAVEFQDIPEGGGGSSTFTGLSDTPSSLTGNKILRVNAAGNAIEETDEVVTSTTTESGAIQVLNMVSMSTVDYEALLTPEEQTLYVLFDITYPTGANLVELGTYSNSTNMDGAYELAISGSVAFVLGQECDRITSIDISDPSAMVELDSYTSTSLNGARGIAISGSVAYVTGRYSNSITSIDISDPSAMVELDSYANTLSLDEANGIEISGNVAYITAYDVDRITSIDISDPSAMVELDSYTSMSLNGAYELAISGSVAFVSSEMGDSITSIDISDPSNLVELDSYTNATLTDAHDIVISGNVAYICSSNTTTITAVDISDPSAITLLGTYSDSKVGSGLTVAGDVLYVVNWDNTIASIDISDPSTMVELSSYTNTSTLNGASNVKILDSVAYVASFNADSLTAIDIT